MELNISSEQYLSLYDDLEAMHKHLLIQAP